MLRETMYRFNLELLTAIISLITNLSTFVHICFTCDESNQLQLQRRKTRLSKWSRYRLQLIHSGMNKKFALAGLISENRNPQKKSTLVHTNHKILKITTAQPKSARNPAKSIRDFPIIGPTEDPPPQNGSTSINMDLHGSKWIIMTYRG